MSGRRPLIRVGSLVALAAMLLSALPPAGAHALRMADRLDGHDDYCSAAGVAPAGPLSDPPAHHGSKVCTHCDGCAGHPGGSWAPASARTFGQASANPDRPCAVADPVATLAADLIAAPPRGPPRPA